MHEGHRERLRKRYEEHGIDTFAPHEALELLLFYALPRRNTNQIAHSLIAHFGSFSSVFDASVKEIMSVEGLGRSTAVFISLISDLLRMYRHDKEFSKKLHIKSSADAICFANILFEGRTYEEFYLVSLDVQNKINNTSFICRGTINETPFYPRAVAEAALQNKAVSVIIMHNHPGGEAVPSQSDIESTKILSDMFATMNINVIDHIIVAENDTCSMVELGILN